MQKAHLQPAHAPSTVFNKTSSSDPFTPSLGRMEIYHTGPIDPAGILFVAENWDERSKSSDEFALRRQDSQVDRNDSTASTENSYGDIFPPWAGAELQPEVFVVEKDSKSSSSA